MGDLNKLLDNSCEQLNESIKQQLNSRRNLAVNNRTQRRVWRLGVSLAPLLILVSLWLNWPSQQLTPEQNALYDDIQLLIEQEQLDFLEEMDISLWIDDSQEST